MRSGRVRNLGNYLEFKAKRIFFIFQVKAGKQPVIFQQDTSLQITQHCPWLFLQRLFSRTAKISAQSFQKVSSSSPPLRASTCSGCEKPKDGLQSQPAAAARTLMVPRSPPDPGSAPTLWEICRTLSRRTISVWSLSLVRKYPNQAKLAPSSPVEMPFLQLKMGLQRLVLKEGLIGRQYPHSFAYALLVQHQCPPTLQSPFPAPLQVLLILVLVGRGWCGLTPKSLPSLPLYLQRNLERD